MLTLRLVCPTDLSKAASAKPVGDVIWADIPRESTNGLVAQLTALGIAEAGTIQLVPVTTWISQGGLTAKCPAGANKYRRNGYRRLAHPALTTMGLGPGQCSRSATRTTAAIDSLILCACSRVGASTITRITGSVPDGRSSIRPFSPSAAAA